MPDMTIDEAIFIFQHLRLTLSRRNLVDHFYSPRRIEALDLAIEALRTDEVEECQLDTCEWFEKAVSFEGSFNACLVQLEAAEEALQALERENKFLGGDCKWLAEEVNRLKANGAVSTLGMCPKCEDLKSEIVLLKEQRHEVQATLVNNRRRHAKIVGEYEDALTKALTDLRLRTDELQAEREKLKALIQYIKEGREFELLLPNHREILELVYKKYCALWGAPDPAPEPKTLDEKIEVACNKYPDLRELFEE